METTKSKKSNPVISVYRGKSIRKYNKLNLRVNQYEMRKFIDLSQDYNLSVRSIFTAMFCKECNGIEIIVFNKSGDQIKIKNPFVNGEINSNSKTTR